MTHALVSSHGCVENQLVWLIVLQLPGKHKDRFFRIVLKSEFGTICRKESTERSPNVSDARQPAAHIFYLKGRNGALSWSFMKYWRRISKHPACSLLPSCQFDWTTITVMCSPPIRRFWIMSPLLASTITCRRVDLIALLHLEQWVYVVNELRWFYHELFQSSISTPVAPISTQDLQVMHLLGSASHQLLLQSGNPHYFRLYQENVVLRARIDNERWAYIGCMCVLVRPSSVCSACTFRRLPQAGLLLQSKDLVRKLTFCPPFPFLHHHHHWNGKISQTSVSGLWRNGTPIKLHAIEATKPFANLPLSPRVVEG